MVNMALHAGLGLYFMLNEVKEYIDQEDIIIIIPEYSLYYRRIRYQRTLYRVLEVYPQGIKYVDTLSIPKVFFTHFVLKIQKNIDFYLLHKKTNTLLSEYSKMGLNKYGDQTLHLGKREKESLRGLAISRFRYKTIPNDFIILTEEFLEFVQNKKARVFFSFPCIAKSRYDDRIGNSVWQLLKEQKYPVLGQPGNYVFEDALFFDTQYHLNIEGRKNRTQRLILQLSAYLQK
ncbi:hypothetical protein ACFL27_21910 [candidate division CSSED10-310 bacterium]|uniref:Uncharacterized protein n=1 Tax=candidate division CSSED10-310 bacterium TaxID=2855610 RepID=A0ABV6Z330_UNCC1